VYFVSMMWLSICSMGAWRGRAGAALVAGAAVLAACTGRPGASPAPVAEPAAVPLVAPTTIAPAPAPAPAAVPPAVPVAVTVPPPLAYLAAGVHEHQVEVDGTARRWTTVVPPVTEGSTRPSVVVVLHGVGGRGADMRSAGFEPLAAAKGVVLVYPDAANGAWNDGRPGADPIAPGAPVDDGRFLRLLIDDTVVRTGADPGRVAVVGFSNGAVMASRLACDLADRVSALALVAGTAGQGFERSCRPSRPVAVMMAAGAGDTVVPYAGGRIANWGTKRRGYLAGVEELFAFWRAQNGCASTQTTGIEARGTECRSGSPVVRYRVTGAAHEWYRAPRLDTTNVVWDFLQRRFSTAA
jgi:polyhydroxybutyrate depolymerase